MEKEDLLRYLPVFVMFGWSMLTPFLAPRDIWIRYALNMAGMIFTIMLLIMVNEGLKWLASKYIHFDATSRNLITGENSRL